MTAAYKPKDLQAFEGKMAEINDRRGASEKQLTAYWLENYCDDHCTLCGNRGVIDSRGVKTPAGKEVGRLNYCICPNGRSLRKQKGDLEWWLKN